MSHLFFFLFFLFSHGNLSYGENSSAAFRFVEKLNLPSPTIGPECLAFDLNDGGPYFTVSDGRVLEWLGPAVGFVDFTAASPNRSKTRCDGSSDPALEPICGRETGLDFYCKTGDLYFNDAYHGLHVVGPNGGRPTQLATAADGVPFKFLNGLVVDQVTGIVYFVEASSKFLKRDFMLIIQTGDMTGRLLKYEPRTREVTVLLRGLGGGGGVAISRDGSFLLVTEFVTDRIQRFWLKGPKANSSEVLLCLPGSPDNIKRNERGEFWVAATSGVREGAFVPMGLRVSEEGEILQEIAFDNIPPGIVTEVQEYKGELNAGSLGLSYVVVYRS